MDKIAHTKMYVMEEMENHDYEHLETSQWCFDQWCFYVPWPLYLFFIIVILSSQLYLYTWYFMEIDVTKSNKNSVLHALRVITCDSLTFYVCLNL